MTDADPVAGNPRPPGDRPLASIAGHLLRRSQQVHTVIWVDEFGRELTSPQYGVLAVLAVQPRIDQRLLGELASLDKSSTTDIVARLVSKMWVARDRDPDDGRRSVLSLAPAAMVAFHHLTPRAARVQERLLEPVVPQEREGLVRDLAAIARFDVPKAGDGDAERVEVLQLDAPGHLIRRAQQVHTAIWTMEFDGELTGPQYAALHVLAQWSGINQRRLGERAALDKSTAADVLQRLDRRGWILRQADPRDARGMLLTLTSAGQEVVDSRAPRVAAVQEELLAPLPASRRALFLDLLARVAFVGDVPRSAQ